MNASISIKIVNVFSIVSMGKFGVFAELFFFYVVLIFF